MLPIVVKNPSMKNLPLSSVKDRNFKRCSQLKQQLTPLIRLLIEKQGFFVLLSSEYFTLENVIVVVIL